jgi:polyisoprenoid-binding protein YceI
VKHAVIDKDVTLKRMLPGDAAVPELTETERDTGPIVAAVLVYVAAVGIGSSLGLFGAHSHTHAHDHSDDKTLAAVVSDWQVESGTLGISVKQLGSDVTGSFEDWTAAITFDETAQDGRHGTFEVTIAIPSLRLGSVTDQALGADFFDASSFATATYAGDILPAEQGYLASGILTLKGAAVPVEMPFMLVPVGDLTEMTGAVMLDRRDFGIGDHMPDESSLGFAVAVEVTLRAKRTE